MLWNRKSPRARDDSSGKDGGPWLSHGGSAGGPGPCSAWKAKMTLGKIKSNSFKCDILNLITILGI